MANAVIMPKQGQSVESCILTKWLVRKGDPVKKGDILFSYETDKASFDEEAKFEGVLLDYFFEEGDEVPVLVNVAVIGQPGEATDEFRHGSSAALPVLKTESLHEEILPAENHETENQLKTEYPIAEGKIKISPRARRLAEQKGIPYNFIKGTGPEGRIIERDVESALLSKPRVTPLAKKAAEEEKIAIGQLGSGLDGSITYADLKSVANIYANDFTDAPLTNVRKIIAKAMHASLQNSAQLTHHLSADARKLLALRNKVKKMMDNGYPHNITLNDMVCYAVIKVLTKRPDANAHFLGDKIRSFTKVHLGLAIDTDRGLMVPAIRNADDLSLTGLSGQLKAVANGCKSGNIDPDLLASTAATFTVSNLGNYGVEIFTPVINLPQVCILGVNTIILRPAQLDDGTFGFVPYMGLSLTYDHRAIDGGPATKLLAEIKQEIENFDLTLI
jgi:pyruvate dehydrogenase E2 component (dihydrolipoamide acetyltransferase)